MTIDFDELSRKLTDDGLLIAAGFVGFHKIVINPSAPPDQVREMRLAFFAGAQHLFGSMMSILDPGEEPTENDMKRMDMIDKELRAFAAQFSLAHHPTKGTA